MLYSERSYLGLSLTLVEFRVFVRLLIAIPTSLVILYSDSIHSTPSRLIVQAIELIQSITKSQAIPHTRVSVSMVLIITACDFLRKT